MISLELQNNKASSTLVGVFFREEGEETVRQSLIKIERICSLHMARIWNLSEKMQ